MNKLKDYLSSDITNIVNHYLMISTYQVNRNKKLINFNLECVVDNEITFNIIKRRIKIWTCNYCPFCDNFSQYVKNHFTNYLDLMFSLNNRNVKYIFNNSYPCNSCFITCRNKIYLLQDVKRRIVL